MRDLVLQKAWETSLDRGDVAACRALIEQGVNIHEPVLIGPTALHFAVMVHCQPLVDLLIECGAQVDHAGTDVQRTALYCAVEKGDRRMAAVLIAAGASLSFVPDDASSGYLTPFQRLVRAGKVDEVRHYATEYGVDLGQRSAAGKTLIQIAGGNAVLKETLRALKVEQSIGRELLAPSDTGVAKSQARTYEVL
jgi:ankyrin repeat protein